MHSQMAAGQLGDEISQLCQAKHSPFMLVSAFGGGGEEETLGLFPTHASKKVQNKTSEFLVKLAFSSFRIIYTPCVTVECGKQKVVPCASII